MALNVVFKKTVYLCVFVTLLYVDILDLLLVLRFLFVFLKLAAFAYFKDTWDLCDGISLVICFLILLLWSVLLYEQTADFLISFFILFFPSPSLFVLDRIMLCDQGLSHSAHASPASVSLVLITCICHQAQYTYFLWTYIPHFS